MLGNILPSDWSGTCTVLSLIAPVTIIQATAEDAASWPTNVHTRDFQFHRHRRSTFDLYTNSPTYIDAIGVPRGVPTEYKLIDQVAAGFESLVWWVTINKNVDRINYVHYNVQRLNIMTCDAITGLHEQLPPR